MVVHFLHTRSQRKKEQKRKDRPTTIFSASQQRQQQRPGKQIKKQHNNEQQNPDALTCGNYRTFLLALDTGSVGAGGTPAFCYTYHGRRVAARRP